MDRPTLSWKVWYGRLSFWLAVVFLILAAVFTPFGVLELREGQLLAREGVETHGTIVDRTTETQRRSNGSTSRSYYITLRFPGPDAVNHSARHSVSQSEYNRLSLGDTLPIRYAASDPSVTELEAGDNLRGAGMIFAMAAALAVGGLIALVFLLRGVAAQRRALIEGERRMAQVTAHKRVGKRSKNYTLEWNDGQQTRRTAFGLRAESLPPVGSEITVFIDPRTGRGWWEGEY